MALKIKDKSVQIFIYEILGMHCYASFLRGFWPNSKRMVSDFSSISDSNVKSFCEFVHLSRNLY